MTRSASLSGAITVDRRAVLVGAAISVVFAVPLALIANGLDLDDDSNLVFGFLGLILAAFVLGGYVAGRRAPETPFTHGALATTAGYAFVQVIAIVRRLALGDDVRWLGVVFNGLLAASAGLLGAVLASRRTAER